jgi:von Willebrand factor type A domain
MPTAIRARCIVGTAWAVGFWSSGAAVGVAAPAALASRVRGADSAPGAEDLPSTQRIAVDLHGPLAVVTVTRILSSERPRSATEESLDLALPDHAALLSVDVGDHGRWQAISAAPVARARGDYLDTLRARNLEARNDPADDDSTYRVRVAHGAVGAATHASTTTTVTLRYKFSVLVEDAQGRLRLRFPRAPEATPLPAEVSVTGDGLSDVEIAGVHFSRAIATGSARSDASATNATNAVMTGRVSTRSGWEISYTLTPASLATASGKDGPALEGAAAVAAVSGRESAIAFSVHARAVAAPPVAPQNVLFLIDRSRSVGLPGLAAEHDVAARLLDLLPPSTRFDALFFDRGVARLFPMIRSATREAIAALEPEMVPDRLANGTDLEGALRAAGDLLRREATSFAPRALLVLITDGALGDSATGARLDAALGAIPGVELGVALVVVRPGDDDRVTAAARAALTAVAEARGGVERELRADDINDAVPSLIEILAAGGDVFSARFALDNISARLPGAVAPGSGITGVVRVPGKMRRSAELVGVTRGRSMRAVLRPIAVDPAWLRPHASVPPAPAESRMLSTPALAALVEPIYHPAPAPPPALVRGTLDRDVIRNTLSLAFMPRARACYQTRPGGTAAMRDLTGRVRLAIDLVRGEVMDARIESSTLAQPVIETCLHESAFALEVPRAYRNDEPVTAIVNLVFRPRTQEKRRSAEDSFPIGAEIDLILEELKNADAASAMH